jgi:hypothetical protein
MVKGYPPKRGEKKDKQAYEKMLDTPERVRDYEDVMRNLGEELINGGSDAEGYLVERSTGKRLFKKMTVKSLLGSLLFTDHGPYLERRAEDVNMDAMAWQKVGRYYGRVWTRAGTLLYYQKEAVDGQRYPPRSFPNRFSARQENMEFKRAYAGYRLPKVYCLMDWHYVTFEGASADAGGSEMPSLCGEEVNDGSRKRKRERARGRMGGIESYKFTVKNEGGDEASESESSAESAEEERREKKKAGGGQKKKSKPESKKVKRMIRYPSKSSTSSEEEDESEEESENSDTEKKKHKSKGKRDTHGNATGRTGVKISLRPPILREMLRVDGEEFKRFERALKFKESEITFHEKGGKASAWAAHIESTRGKLEFYKLVVESGGVISVQGGSKSKTNHEVSIQASVRKQILADAKQWHADNMERIENGRGLGAGKKEGKQSLSKQDKPKQTERHADVHDSPKKKKEGRVKREGKESMKKKANDQRQMSQESIDSMEYVERAQRKEVGFAKTVLANNIESGYSFSVPSLIGELAKFMPRDSKKANAHAQATLEEGFQQYRGKDEALRLMVRSKEHKEGLWKGDSPDYDAIQGTVIARMHQEGDDTTELARKAAKIIEEAKELYGRAYEYVTKIATGKSQFNEYGSIWAMEEGMEEMQAQLREKEAEMHEEKERNKLLVSEVKKLKRRIRKQKEIEMEKSEQERSEENSSRSAADEGDNNDE